MLRMALNALLRSRRYSEVDQGPSHEGTPIGSPTTTTPNTRKRQHVEGYYRDLNNRRRSVTPILQSTSRNTPSYRSLTPSLRRSPRNTQRATPPRIDPRTKRFERRPLFLPEHEPILQPCSNSITVDHYTNERQSSIQKQVWW